jgi:hypothetical protein
MPYLGDYLGQLLSEISMARLHADLETIRLAELYASHTLLRTLPVPHLRLPDVDLEIPVLVQTSEEPRPGESARGGLKLSTMSEKFDELLTAHMARAGIEPSAADRRILRVALEERQTQLGLPSDIAIDVNRVADDLASTALTAMQGFKGRAKTAVSALSPSFSVELKNAARLEFLKLRQPPPRLLVSVTSAEIREAGTAENIIRIRLKVSEQGVEWTRIESEGVETDRLVPE